MLISFIEVWSRNYNSFQYFYIFCSLWGDQGSHLHKILKGCSPYLNVNWRQGARIWFGKKCIFLHYFQDLFEFGPRDSTCRTLKRYCKMSRLALNEKATFFFVSETQQFVQGVKWWRQQVACVSSKHPFATFNMVRL